MRIIRGEYKGRRINFPPAFRLRPTTDFAKEALFNILENKFDLSEVKVLDLFSGSGNISFEFISRGAKEVYLVEVVAKHIAFIRKIITSFSYEQVTVIKGDVLKVIPKINKSFNVIFADPPYNYIAYKKLPELIINNNIVLPGGIIIIEHSSQTNFSDSPFFINHKKYGDVNFSFFSDNRPTPQL